MEEGIGCTIMLPLAGQIVLVSFHYVYSYSGSKDLDKDGGRTCSALIIDMVKLVFSSEREHGTQDTGDAWISTMEDLWSDSKKLETQEKGSNAEDFEIT